MAGSVRESAIRDWLGDAVCGAAADADAKRKPATAKQQHAAAIEVRPSVIVIARL